MRSDDTNASIRSWLKDKGYTDEDAQKILDKLAERDHETLSDDAVTVRDRDSLEQVRVPIGGVRQLLEERLFDASVRR